MRVIHTQAEMHETTWKTLPSEYLLVTAMNGQIDTLSGDIIPSLRSFKESFRLNAFNGRTFEGDVSIYKLHALSHPMSDWHASLSAYDNSSLFMNTLHLAFAKHLPFSLSPEAIWYCIVHEIAIHLRQLPDRYRQFFTTSNKKKTLVVRNDRLEYRGNPAHWVGLLELMRGVIQERIPQDTTALLLPDFTTTTPVTRIARWMLFLNIVSNYYEIEVHTLCGIPEIQIEGEAEDWQKIIEHVEQARQVFTGLAAYFDHLIPVLKEIASAAGGEEPDPDFWNSIYKYKQQSGSPGIDGWITSLIAHRRGRDGQFRLRRSFDWRANAKDEMQPSLDADSLPSHFAQVPFVWKYFDKQYQMVFLTGFLGLKFDRFITPQLGYAVLEKPS